MHARDSIALFWGFKLVLTLSFFAICYSQSTDAARYYCNMIDDVYPAGSPSSMGNTERGLDHVVFLGGQAIDNIQ